MMKHRATCMLASLMLLALALPPIAAAQPGNAPAGPPEYAGPPQDVVDRLLERGFQQVEPAVFQRPAENAGAFETIAFGLEGHEYLLQQLQGKLQLFEARQQEAYLPELADAIANLETIIARVETVIAEQRSALTTSPGAAAGGLVVRRLGDLTAVVAAAQACDTTVHRLADATPGTGGPRAATESSFTDTCGDYGEVVGNTIADGWQGTSNHVGMFDDCFDNGAGSASCTALSSVTADNNCFADAYSEVRINVGGGLPVTWSVSDSTFYCILLQVNILGPTSVYVPAYTSKLVTWTADVTGGEGAKSYTWRYNGVVVGSGSSYTRGYSHPGYGRTYYDNVSVTVTDLTGSATDSQSVTVIFEDPCSDPCFCLQTTTSVGAATVGGDLTDPAAIPCPVE